MLLRWCLVFAVGLWGVAALIYGCLVCVTVYLCW